jgi:hypothetical protein
MSEGTGGFLKGDISEWYWAPCSGRILKIGHPFRSEIDIAFQKAPSLPATAVRKPMFLRRLSRN